LLLAARRHLAICTLIVVTGLVSLLAMRAAHWQEITIYTHPLSNFWLLALGGLGGLMISENGGGVDGARGVRAWLGHGATLFVLSLCLVGFCATEPAWSDIENPLLFTVVSGAYGLCIAALVCSIACCRNTVVLALLEARWVAGLGRISYGFYLYHNLVPDLTRNHHAQALFGGAVPLWAHVAGIGASFAISLGLAVLSWRIIEEPILRLKTRRGAWDKVDATSKHAATPTSTSPEKQHSRHALTDEGTASDAA
jgi:peptidoglycan/LPS O-acetylase OafA/YrhL